MSGMQLRFGRSIAVLCILALAACSPQFRNHGYMPNEEDLSMITVGVDTRATVEEAVGAPAMSGVTTDSATAGARHQLRFCRRGQQYRALRSGGRADRADLAPHHRYQRHE